MDISSISFSMPSGNVTNAIDVALLSKVLDTVEESGDALTQMMEAVATGLGQHIDLRA
ncbi:MAG: putative motility protein [Lachnospiraceae bacterium]|jgi:hypothetical protein|nr:putative motility protein [Lachnospiraceae bacterium]